MSFREEIMGDCRLILGDCREVLPTLGKVDACITDPPYGMNKDIANDSPEDADALIAQLVAWAKAEVTGNSLMFWSAQRWDRIRALFDPKRVMIWNKGFALYAPHNVGYRYEPIVWVSGSQALTKRGDIFEAFPIAFKAQEENAAHPTQKPVALLYELVRDFSSGLVVDPCMGSGTTGVACARLGRSFIGIEIDPIHYETACRRISEAYKQPDMFIERPDPPKQEALEL